MSESKLYVGFFNRYKLFILIPTLLVTVLTYVYQLQKPDYIEIQSVYEYDYSDDRVSEDIILAEQLVGNLREEYGSEKNSKVTFYRSAPLTIHFVSTSTNKVSAEGVFNKISQNLKNKYPLKVLIEKRESAISNFKFIEIFAATLSTLLFLILVCSLIEYFRKY